MGHYKAKPFAEYNFGPSQPIFFVIVLFESQSKTLFRVLFSSLYLQICIFYFGISEYLNFTRELRPEIQLEILKQSSTRETSEIDSKGQITPSCGVICTCIGLGTRVRVTTRYSEKVFKKMFVVRRIQTKLSPRKRLNTRSISLLLTYSILKSLEGIQLFSI